MSIELPRCSRGEIWLLDWNPRRGSEQGGFRPGLVVQTDLGNHAPGARTTILVPLTSQGRPFVFYVPLPRSRENGLPSDSWANCTQLLTVDKERLVKRLGRASAAQMERVAEALRATLELG